MRGSKSKSPPQRGANTRKGAAARARGHGRAQGAQGGGTGSRREGTRAKAARTQGGGAERSEAPSGAGADYSVNALSKLTGRDRRTLDKALMGVAPTRVEGRTKFYRLEDVEAALRKPGSSLKDQKTIEEIRKLKLDNDEKAALLVTKASVKASLRRSLAPAVAILEQRLVNEYPTAVAGLDVPQARIYGKRLCDELLGFLQQLEKEWQ